MKLCKYRFVLIFTIILLVPSIPSATAGDDPGKASRDFVTYGISLENFNPLILKLNPNSWSLRRGWVDYSYEYLDVKPFKETRRIVDHYREEPIYDVWASEPYFRITQMQRYLEHEASRWTLERLESPSEDWWFSYYSRYGRVADRKMPSNSFQNFRYGFRYFQGFSGWRRKWIRPQGSGFLYGVQIPYWFNFLYEVGKRRIPVYTEEEYTRYHSIRYRITDYLAENWPELEVTVTLNGLEGYEDNVRLSVETGNRHLKAKITDEVISVGSTAVTTLVLSPDRELRGSNHTITIEGADSYGRTKSINFELELQTSEKPPIENVILEEWYSDTEPDREGKISSVSKKKVGVHGRLRDAETRELLLNDLNDAKVKVHATDLTGLGNHRSGNARWPSNSQYEYSSLTYSHEEWSMDLVARAKNHRPKYAWNIKDSTESSGTVGKNFFLPSISSSL